MVNMITTIGGWTLMGVIGYTYWWKYSNDRARRRGPPSRPEREQTISREKKRGNDKVENVGEVEFTNAPSEKLKQRKKDKTKAKEPLPAASAVSSAVNKMPETAAEPNSKRKEVDDMAFARQLASTQQGTTLKAPDMYTGKVRTNKVRGLDSGPRSSENLRDADHTWQSSGQVSSSVAAEAGEDEAFGQASLSSDPTISSKGSDHGISDMLEAPAPGPATLRVVPSEKPQRVARPAAPKKPAQEPETKKQRQRRKKREAEKEQLAEDESQRRALMERQLKTARTLEGTAKSGQYKSYTPPQGNAWQTVGGDAAPQTAKTSDVPLLDTFEATNSPKIARDTELADVQSDTSHASPDSEPRSSGEGSVAGGYDHGPVIADSSAPGDSANDWEDYQMRALRQQDKADSEWQEVASRKGKKTVK